MPGEATPPAMEASPSGEFDFSGLPRFDIGEMGLTPEEQAYLLSDSAVSEAAALDTAAAPAPAQPSTGEDHEALPSWLSGEATPVPAIPEPLAELESNALPSWMGGSTVPAPTAEETPRAVRTPAEPWTAPTFGQPEPMVAEVFGEEDMQAWPAPAEPAAPVESEVPALAAEEQAPVGRPRRAGLRRPRTDGDRAYAGRAHRPTAPALRYSGEPDAAEEVRYNPPLPPVAAPLEAAALRPAASVAPATPPAGRETMDDLLRHLEDQPDGRSGPAGTGRGLRGTRGLSAGRWTNTG